MSDAVSEKSFARQDIARDLAAIALILLSNLIVYREYWTGAMLFTGKDLLTAFGLLLNFQTDCVQGGSLPLWNPFMNFGYPFVEHYSNTLFFPTHLLMGLFTGSNMELIQREILLWIFIGGTGIYLCVREMGSSRTAGVVAGVSFMFCGQMTALPQWHLLVYNAACFPFLLLGYHRAKRQGHILSITAVAFLAFAIFGGHAPTTVLSIYLFGLYVLVDAFGSRQALQGIKFLVLTLALAALLATPKLLPMYHAIQLGPRMKAPEVTKDPFNIINSYNFMGLLLPVKYFFAIYIGQLNIMAAIYGVFRRRIKLVTPLLLMTVLSAWLLMVDNSGTVSILRSAVDFLPMMRLVRNEWFEWFHPSIFAILYLSRFVDDFLGASDLKGKLMAAGIFLALLTAVFMLAFDTTIHLKAFIAHAAFAALWLAPLALAGRSAVQLLLVAALLAGEFSIVFNRVNVDQPPVREDNRIGIVVTHQIMASRSFRDGELVNQKFPVMVLSDRNRPSVSDSRLNPVLYSGLDGNFIDSMNQKRFAGWWYNTQERYDFIELKESPQLAQMEGWPLYLLLGAGNRVLPEGATFDRISCSDLGFTTGSADPSVFLLHQFYDERWKVRVDGKEERPVRTNRYFMGVALPSGKHNIEFIFRDRLFNISIGISLFTMSGIIIFMVIKRCRRRLPVISGANADVG